MSYVATRDTETATTTWTIDPAHTNVGFAVRHLMISTVRGRFADVRGTVVADEMDRTKGTVDVVIAVGSIDTREAQRDAHLRSGDFFDAEHFPEMTFRSTRIEDAPGDTFKLTGNLTIRGVTREIMLDVTAEGRGPDPWGGERAGFTATGKISRGDFGLTYNAVLETGGVVIGDEVKITIDTELVKKA
jgi:polyisoprenoid-binding protein YceI